MQRTSKQGKKKKEGKCKKGRREGKVGEGKKGRQIGRQGGKGGGRQAGRWGKVGVCVCKIKNHPNAPMTQAFWKYSAQPEQTFFCCGKEPESDINLTTGLSLPLCQGSLHKNPPGYGIFPVCRSGQEGAPGQHATQRAFYTGILFPSVIFPGMPQRASHVSL